jgi:hypothetical protein
MVVVSYAWDDLFDFLVTVVEMGRDIPGCRVLTALRNG